MSTLYPKRITDISMGALLEVCMALEPYQTDFVLAGGWAPYFLLKDIAISHFSHCGSKDTDVVLRPVIMRKYRTIRNIILSLGYTECDSHYRFKKPFTDRTGVPFDVELDFLTEPDVPLPSELTAVQADLQAVFIEGISMVFDQSYSLKLEGQLPENGTIALDIQVANIAGVMVTKGMALPRPKNKDSYDIYAVAGFYAGSPKAAANSFNKAFENGTTRGQLVAKAMKKIKMAFASESNYGCFRVGAFMENNAKRVDAYVRVNQFLDNIVQFCSECGSISPPMTKSCVECGHDV